MAVERGNIMPERTGPGAGAGEPVLFSVDDHVIEPPHVWESRLPAKLRDRGPRLVSTRDEEYWLFEGERVPPQGVEASAGKDPRHFTMGTVRYDDMRPGFYDPVARLADMDTDGVRAQVLFPSGVPRICGKRFLDTTDRELGLACIRAWNDWMLEEWCAAAPDRYVPLAILPLWDPVLSAEEVRRVAAGGTRGVTFSEAPHLLGLPTIHDPAWDPLWDAVTETDIAVCLHIGSAGQGLQRLEHGSAAPAVTLISLNAMVAVSELLFSPVFARWPGLRFVLSEGGMGWVPYVLERAEYTWERHRFWLGHEDAQHPRDVFARHIGVCFIEDLAGIDNRSLIGVDSIMWEGDYPHTDSSWPNSRQRLARQLKSCTPDEVARITHANAERFFRFSLATGSG